jgi:hypothetical protein
VTASLLAAGVGTHAVARAEMAMARHASRVQMHARHVRMAQHTRLVRHRRVAQRRHARHRRLRLGMVQLTKRGAAAMVSHHGWSRRNFACLDRLWMRESGWNHRAYNRFSGAYGIPQALPGGKMRSAGRDWRTNPRTQIIWGLGYIERRYGTPCRAWRHSRATGWY